MAQFVQNSTNTCKTHLGHDTVAFFSSVCVVIISAFCGYGLAFLFLPVGASLSLVSADVYAKCTTPGDYALRAAELCRPVLIETALLWISAYVEFEKQLLASVFALRGVSLGLSIGAVVLTAEASEFAYLPLIYAAITAAFLIFTRHLRRDIGRISFAESAVFAGLTAGVSSALTLLSTILLA